MKVLEGFLPINTLQNILYHHFTIWAFWFQSFFLLLLLVQVLLLRFSHTPTCAMPFSSVIIFGRVFFPYSSSTLFLPQLRTAIITGLQSEDASAVADKGWQIVSNDGSTSAGASQSCLFQQ